MKYFIITYGCQMNKSDSERIAAVLEKIGYKNASKIDEADLIVVNMCSVRQSAVDRVYGLQPMFKTLKTKNYKLQTILTGCILKKDRKKFIEYFDYILNIKNLTRWSKVLATPNSLNQSTIVSDLSQSGNYLKIKPEYSSFPIGYVPISTGCNNFCSYCVVPYTRGPEICRPVKDIISEVRDLVKKGYKEIWLLGQNVNSYNSQISINVNSRISANKIREDSRDINFPKLLKIINNIPGDFWIRFTSSHPKDFSDELIEAMSRCKKITPYLNLPVQSGDNEILKKMNRNYTVEYYKNLVKKIRQTFAKIRGKSVSISISTDIIVGFPGETKKQFKNTVRLFKEIKFDMAYIAQYSPRPGTAAFKMKDDVTKEKKREREKILTEVLKKTALAKNKKLIGKTITILPSEYKNGFLIGKSFHYKTVKWVGSKDLIGKFVRVKITDAQPWGLKGKLLK
ncbi:tRNA (N6-isopentenyl adenosine(37)-C2)-methylthiotransferase MiaB [bacterium]|nr:tRNA (N6-isopentenyl adenosine(37)-C2)-methylthiotransferase MiaB [bacterium]